jgi:ABC-2 type transport system permease protein
MNLSKYTSLSQRKFLLFVTLVIGVGIVLYFLARTTRIGIDLTEEKRFTISGSSEKVIRSFDQPVYVKVMLDGEFPAGFKRLQSSTKDLLDRFRSINRNIIYTVESPLGEDQQEADKLKEELAKEGIIPINLIVKGSNEKSATLIYPYTEVTYGPRKMYVNLLEEQKLDGSDQEALNSSVGLLEYKFVNAFQKIANPTKKQIIFTQGHGELTSDELSGLQKAISPFFNVYFANIDSTYKISKNVDLIVIARPRAPFTDKEKFVLDQFLMNGGNLMFLIDKTNAAIDSISPTDGFVPFEYPTGLDDLLFKYGVRIQPNMVRDLECSKIPMVVGKVGTNVQTELFNYYYHLIPAPASNHPIVKSLDRVNLFFPSSIDTIKTKYPIKKTILLQSSKYTSLQFIPARLDFEILRYQPDPSKFNKPPAALAVLLEGKFGSLYESRVPAEMQEALAKINAPYKPFGEESKILVVSDGEIARNHLNRVTGEIQPLGYNRFEKYTYDNVAFMVNSIEYMMDDDGILQARTKDIKLRLLDHNEIKHNKVFWQLLNVLFPLVLLFCAAWVYQRRRKKKYSF